jgi:hypothetical protein
MLRVCAAIVGICALFVACGQNSSVRNEGNGGTPWDPNAFSDDKRSVDPKLEQMLKRDPDWVRQQADSAVRPEQPVIEIPETQRQDLAERIEEPGEQEPALTVQESDGPQRTELDLSEVTLRTLIRAMQVRAGKDPGNIDLWQQLAMLHILSGDQPEARRILDKVGKGGGQLLNLMSAYNHEQLGMNDEAIAEIQSTLTWLNTAMPLELVDLAFAIKIDEFDGIVERATPNQLVPGELIALYVETANYSRDDKGQVAGLTATPRLYDGQGVDITPRREQGWIRHNDAAYRVRNRDGRVYHVWVLVWPKNLKAGLVELKVSVQDVSGKSVERSMKFAVRGN